MLKAYPIGDFKSSIWVLRFMLTIMYVNLRDKEFLFAYFTPRPPSLTVPNPSFFLASLREAPESAKYELRLVLIVDFTC